MNQQETGAFTALTTPKYYVFITKEKEEIPERVKEEPQLYVGQLDTSTPLEPIHWYGIGGYIILAVVVVYFLNKLKHAENEFRKQTKRNNNS